MSINVIKPISKPIRLFQFAEVDVKCDDFIKAKERENEENAIFIQSELVNALAKYGLRDYGYNKFPQIKIVCLYSNGYGPPQIGRHFQIRLRFVKEITIKIIETDSGEIIGEIHYYRPFLSRNQKDYIQKLFDELSKSDE